MAKMWNLDHQSLCTSISTVSDKINGLCANNDQLQNQLTLHTVSSLSTYNRPPHLIAQLKLLMNVKDAS